MQDIENIFMREFPDANSRKVANQDSDVSAVIRLSVFFCEVINFNFYNK